MGRITETIYYACTLGIPTLVLGLIVWAMRGAKYHG